MSAVSSRPRIRSIVLPVASSTPELVAAAGQQLLASGAPVQLAQFTSALVVACTRASALAGFRAATVVRVSGVQTRIVATSPAGHALVTEIRVSLSGEASLATEVVGLRDGSCQGILDQFDSALEAEGVRGSAPTRRFTGGVCELAAARAFSRRLAPSRLEKPLAAGPPRNSRRRAQGPKSLRTRRDA